MKKYLIVRTSAIGDVVHTLPVLRIIKDFDPDCEIHWVAKKVPAMLLENNPNISRIFILKSNYFELARLLRRNKYRAVFDLQGLFRTAILSRLVRAESYVGYSRDYIREKGAQLFYTQRISPESQNPHVISRGISLVCRYFNSDDRNYENSDSWIFDLPNKNDAKAYIASKLTAFDRKRIIVLNPGAGWGNKQLMPSHFGKLADILSQHYDDLEFIVTYASDEEKLAKKVAESAKRTKLHLIDTNIFQLIALLRRSNLFIGGDTGPMQMAAALGVPIVAIFGPTNPLHNGPFSHADIECIAQNTKLDCLNCHKRTCPRYNEFPPPCMQITPEYLAELSLKQLSMNHHMLN